MQQIFRKYDLRGIVGSQFHVFDSYQITQSIITFFKQKFPKLKNIAVGMDGRTSSPAIKNQVCKSILDAGLNAHFIGVCPTPTMYFASHTMDIDAGIMITASHNPKEYNGFKLVLNKNSVWGDDIEKIKEICISKNFYTSNETGKYFEHNAVESHVDSLVDEFKDLVGADLNFVIDCGNGVAGAIIPQLVAKMKWKNVSVLYPEIDGDYPNHNPNPVELKNMLDVKSFLEQNQSYQFGVGLDGDCDRVGAMTKDGYLIPGDILLGIFALNIDQKYNPSAVMDVKCSDAVPRTLEKKGILCHISPTGHAYIKDCIKKNNATIGGELSGHYCFRDRHWGFDDAIYAMLRLCEIAVKNNLESLVSEFPKTWCSPEFRIPCDESKKEIIIKDATNKCSLWPNAKIIALDGVRVQTQSGWAIVRASNTESAISVRIEGFSDKSLKELTNKIYTILSKHIDTNTLKNIIKI